MRRHLIRALLVSISALTMGCEQPSFQHSPTATVTSTGISCYRMGNTPPNTTTCIALVRYSDGGPLVGVTQNPIWASSNTAVGTVSNDCGPPSRFGCGIVTHIASGVTEISATFEGVTGVFLLTVVFTPN